MNLQTIFGKRPEQQGVDRVLALVEQDAELIRMRRLIQQIAARYDAHQAEVQKALEAVAQQARVDVDGVFREMADHLKATGVLPGKHKFSDDLRIGMDDQVIILLANSKERTCDCPVCTLFKAIRT